MRSRSRVPGAVRLALVTVLAAVVAACGSTEPEPVTVERTAFADTLHIDLTRFTRLPSGVYVRDSILGGGARLDSGRTVRVRYTAQLPSGRVIPSRGAGGAPYAFVLGTGAVIAGWDLGLPGMRVGGLRQLIVPPELGYGREEYAGIPGNAVLVFTVDAVGTP
jgi:FKBP-type peptidyl-prolyl cis-trans isomerase FkpA